jgi:multidrug efflux pump subunit AcrA (membrane-fusion protein)
MGIEQTIQELVAAIRENTAAMLALSKREVVAPAAEVKAETKPTTAKAAIAKALEDAKKAKEEVKAKKEAAAAEAAKEEEKQEAEALDYDKDMAPRFTAFLGAHGREAFLRILGDFKAKKGSEVKPEDYAAVLTKLDEFELTT